MRRKRKLRCYNHIREKQVRGYIGEEIGDAYYRFCLERNPWDRLVSLYYRRYKSEPRPAISEFIDSGVPLRLKKRGYEVHTTDGAIAVDRVCLFENLKEELGRMRVSLALPENLTLPKAKSSLRSDERHCRDILDDDARDKIGRVFSEEISWLGYEF